MALSTKFILQLIADRSKFKTELEAAKKDMDGLSGRANVASKGMMVGAAVGLTALTGVVAKSVQVYNDYGKGVKQAMRMTGATAEEASQLVAQWKYFGVMPDRASLGMRTLANKIKAARDEAIALGNDSGKAMKLFTEVGIDPAIVPAAEPVFVPAVVPAGA